MNNLIDQDALLEEMNNWRNMFSYRSDPEICDVLDAAVEIIEDSPIANAIEVVRCGECIQSRPPLFPHPTKLFCTIIEQHREPDWFCKDGEKEEKK